MHPLNSRSFLLGLLAIAAASESVAVFPGPRRSLPRADFAERKEHWQAKKERNRRKKQEKLARRKNRRRR